MCGIFLILNNKNFNEKEISKNFNKGKARGPDNSILQLLNKNDYLGFHRLSINGLDKISNQPFNIENIVLICNGEIYNYKQLLLEINEKPITNSDCEVIIYLYLKFGIEYTLNLLDGVFTFILIDKNKDLIYISRDVYGVRPLYYLNNKNLNFHNNELIFASELKQIISFKEKLENKKQNEYESFEINYFEPGTYMEIIKNKEKINIINKKIRYNSFNLLNFSLLTNNQEIYITDICNNIEKLFKEAVKKRVENTDQPIACLLSGGLDSSIVCSLVNKFYKKNRLETFSIGLAESEDLKYAKIVANYLGTNHHEIIVSEDEFFEAIPEVIEKIESFDTTTVRASVGNYLVAKYISQKSNAKVILNGDGSDELMGGYLYLQNCPNHFEFDKECKSLLRNIYMFDVLRSDKSISSNGLEPRTPFLDRNFTNYYLSISSKLRFNTNKLLEKFLFRKAFDKDYLPEEILWRKKEAFSDGVSKITRSWSEIIREKIDNLDTIKEENNNLTREQNYYLNIFNNYYPNCNELIPFYWLPKYTNIKDASARKLNCYDNKIDIERIRNLNCNLYI